MSLKNLGSKVRAHRRSRKLTQAELARRLGISPSYLNLIEHDQRPLTAELLIKLAAEFQLDFSAFITDREDRVAADLMELFSDPLFEDHELNSAEVRELAGQSPNVARAVLHLYSAYQKSRESAATLAGRMYHEQEDGDARVELPTEEVTDFIQHHLNYFAELEQAAETFIDRIRLPSGGRFAAMSEWFRDRGIEVVGSASSEVVRRYDAARKRITISETLPRHSRTFQLAAQVALIEFGDLLDRLTDDPHLTSDSSRGLGRVVLANYFAGAVLMPYRGFLDAAIDERYDVEILAHRFGAGFEQVCHRLTTLRRAGAEGVPFHMIRVDLAGNISKRFSASGIRFARFSGACPRWNVFSAFQTPGRVRVQLSRMSDGAVYFCAARTVPKGRGGYHAPHTVQAVGLGCRIEYARELVYSDGIDLERLERAVPVGVTCRLCDRTDCEQRTLPSLRNRLVVDENVRGISFFTPVD